MKADGSVIIDTKIGTDGMEKGFESLKKGLSSVGVSVEDLGDKLKIALSNGASAPIQNAFAKVQLLQAQLTSVTAEFKAALANDDDKGAARLGAQRTAIYDKLENARRRLTQAISAEAEKERKKEEAETKKAQKAKEKAYKRATKSATAFGNRLARIASGALVFNVIRRGLSEVSKYFGNALKSNEKFADAWAKLKGAALTAIQPIYELLLPVLTTALEVATKLATLLGKAFASLAGKNSDQMKENAEALYEQATATEAAGDAAEEAKKQLAGFDKLNVLNSGESSANTEATTESANFELQSIDLNSKLTEMASLTSAAIFALGIILTLSGANIPLGLGMIVLGGLALYKSIEESWGSVESNVISTAESIALIGGAVTLALGIIICFACPTHLALGLGLVIGGAALLGGEAALNWNAIKEALQDPVGAAVALIGGIVLIVLGVLLCFAQAWGFGIGLIAAGAVFLGGTIAVNWNAIKEALQGPIGEVTAIVCGALLVLGVILCFTGVGIPLGIGLIVAGAAGLATVVAVNWNTIVMTVKEKFGAINEWIQAHGFVVLILGIMLLFSGVGIPVGLGLIDLGIKGMVSGKDPLWNTIFEKIKEVWKSIKNFWNQHIAKVFTGQFWKDLAKKCGNGLIAGFEGAINGIISMFESMINWVVGGLNKISIDVPDWVPGIGGKKFGFNIPEAKFKRVSIPRLAQGAVIPPNREFMAVLGDQKHGTNIEAPLETIKQALAEVLALQEGGSETVVTVNFTGNLAQLARVLKPAIDIENKRKGDSLATGGAN